MRKLLRLVLLTSFCTVFAGRVSAFSLGGPFDTWQTADLGYNLNFIDIDVAGPMNLGEEYRWTTPFITYAFDESFVQYFGQSGVDAVSSALTVLNNLPAISQLDVGLTNFARSTMRLNSTAQQLNLYDLKSITLSYLMEVLGLVAPERYTFTLRAANTALPEYTVIERNFDPYTFLPSTRANGTLYTYQIRHFTAPITFSDAQELAVDTSSVNISVAAFFTVGGGLVEPRVSAALAQLGFYYSGLTREDVGGLRYLYAKGNQNLEAPPADVLLTALSPKTPAGVLDLSQALGSSSAWTLVSVNTLSSSNTAAGGTTGTQPVGGVSAALGTFLVPYPYGTLISANQLAGAGNTGTTTTTTSNVVSAITSTGYRPGLDKLRFVDVSRYYDPLLMTTTNGYLVSYDDRVINTNGVLVTQRVGRLQPHPDIVFSAADVGVDAVGVPLLGKFAFGGAYFVKSATITATSPAGLAGPGIIDPDGTGIGAGATPITLTFNKVGPYFVQGSEGGLSTAAPGFVWGTYDGTTNAPVVYPQGTDVIAYSRALFGN